MLTPALSLKEEIGLESLQTRGLQQEIGSILGDMDIGVEEPLSLWPIEHAAVNKVRTARFFSLRRWPAENRKDSITFVLSKKETRDEGFISEVAREFADFILTAFRNVSGFLVTNAPAGNSVKRDFHLATLIAKEAARLLRVKHQRIFRDYPKKTKNVGNIEDKKNTSLKEGTQLKRYKGIILIDDAATTGTTMETCVDLVKGFFVIPIVWVYHDKVGSS